MSDHHRLLARSVMASWGGLDVDVDPGLKELHDLSQWAGALPMGKGGRGLAVKLLLRLAAMEGLLVMERVPTLTVKELRLLATLSYAIDPALGRALTEELDVAVGKNASPVSLLSRFTRR